MAEKRLADAMLNWIVLDS